jgi:hypothetical protein
MNNTDVDDTVAFLVLGYRVFILVQILWTGFLVGIFICMSHPIALCGYMLYCDR